MRPTDIAPSLAALHAGRRASITSVATTVAAVLAALASPLALADDPDLPALQRQVDELKQEIDQLQAGPSQNGNAATPAGADAGPTFHAGPVKITLGGFVELMVIDRNRNESADFSSNYNGSIPYPNSHNYDISEFHQTERQSRLSALVEGPETDQWATEAYIESDFGGAGSTANNNESSSFSPRVRHFYADLQDKTAGWYLLFGQTWSFVTAEKIGMMPRQENIPLTIDAQYVPGFSWLRVPQIRFVDKLSNAISVGVSLENPAAQITSNSTTGAPAISSTFSEAGASNAYAPTTNVTYDYLPDVIAKIAFDPGWGHYEAFALNRWFRARDITVGAQTNVRATGTGFGGNMLLPLVPKIVDFQASILAGKGIGRYGSAQLPDATINPTTGGPAPLRGYQALTGLVVRPTDTLTTYAYVGKEQVDAQSYAVEAAGKTYGYGYGNPLFDNSGCETEGSSVCAANTSSITSGVLGAWWKFYQGSLGNAQIGLSDTYIKRAIFSGIGGDPNTNINIALASFRFYPFQK